MNKQRGFTIIELLIVLAVVFIIGSIALGGLAAVRGGFDGFDEAQPVVDVNGNGNAVNVVAADKLPLNIRCHGGYLFMVDKDGNASQVKDNEGAGATCYE